MKKMIITPDVAMETAFGAAMGEGVENKRITEADAEHIIDRANTFYRALVTGKVLIPNSETRVYDILTRQQAEGRGYGIDREDDDDDDLVIDA